jgi:hypothetical protein
MKTKEILANHLIKYSVDKLTDPDYINQTIIYLVSSRFIAIFVIFKNIFFYYL